MTTFQERTYTCPICEEDVAGTVVTSTNRMGQHTDFCPVTAGFNAVPLSILACTNCGYAGYADDFEEGEYSPREKLDFMNAGIPEGLIPLEARLDRLDPDHCYYLACLTRRHFGADASLQGDLLLRAYWCLRLEGGRPRDETAASRYRREAIDRFEEALTEAETPERRRELLYLRAELQRREGRFEEAHAGFTRFLDDPPPERDWKRAAEVLRLRAAAQDPSDLTFEQILGGK